MDKLIMKLDRFIKQYFSRDSLSEVSKLNLRIKELEDQLDKAETKLSNLEQDSKKKQAENELEQKFNNKYPKVDRLYSGRYIQGYDETILVDVRNFFTLNDSQLNKIVKDMKLEGLSDDEKMLRCLQWVLKNFTYDTDNKNIGKSEYWMFSFESLSLKKGDCEDGAVLTANLAVLSGIPYWKLRVTTGLVINPHTKKEEGHAYLTYYCQETDKWVVVDWCYAPNNLPMNKRKAYEEDEIYGGEVWFSFNVKYSFAKSTKNLKGVETNGKEISKNTSTGKGKVQLGGKPKERIQNRSISSAWTGYSSRTYYTRGSWTANTNLVGSYVTKDD